MEITACFDNSRAGFWLHAASNVRSNFVADRSSVRRGSFISHSSKQLLTSTGKPTLETLNACAAGADLRICFAIDSGDARGSVAVRKRAALRPRPHHEKSQRFGSGTREPRLPASLVLVRRVAFRPSGIAGVPSDGLRRSAARPAICKEIVHGISPSPPELYGRPPQRQFPSTFGPRAAP